LVRQLADFVGRGVFGPKWCWMQYREHSGKPDGAASCWLWDATCKAPSGNVDYSAYLLGVLVERNGGWEALHIGRESSDAMQSGKQGSDADASIDSRVTARQRDASDDDEPSASVEDRANALTDNGEQLKLSLISSFLPTRFTHAARVWPTDVKCELYTFMQTEVEPRLRDLGLAKNVTAVDVLARMEDRHQDALEWATLFNNTANRRNVSIIGFASFIPEVSARQGSQRSNQAIKAVRFLCRLAMRLADLGQPMKVIEIVAGSRIDGLLAGERTEGSRHFHARVLSDAEALTRFLSSVREAVTPIGSEFKSKRLVIAAELEPGPLYVLRDWCTLHEMCRRLDGDESILKSVLGVNLDIAHWILASDFLDRQATATAIGNRLTVAGLARSELIRRRIVHAHCSGHFKGHVGDAPPLDVKRRNELLPWLGLLRDIYRDAEKRDLPATGFVSLELEATKNEETLRRAIEQLRSLCNE
jgi:sugar phosphate isomerase/epimerase